MAYKMWIASLVVLNLCLLCKAQNNTTTAVPPTTPDMGCPGGWLDADLLGCYKFLDTAVNLSWVVAQQKCESIGGYLAEPLTARQAEFIHGVAIIDESFSGIDHWWIGLTDLGNEGHWTWPHSGEDLTDSFWGTDRPNNKTGNTDDCGVMVLRKDNFWWEDRSCLTEQVQNKIVAPICQHDSAAASTTGEPTSTTARCPADWDVFGGHCYLADYGTYRTWMDAEAYCNSFGGHLASIHSQAEEDFLYSLLGAVSITWLGATDKNQEGVFVWTDGSDWDYSNWDSGEPNQGPGDGDCLGFYLDGTRAWYDRACNDPYASYICKI